jgi:hypothetical protein
MVLYSLLYHIMVFITSLALRRCLSSYISLLKNFVVFTFKLFAVGKYANVVTPLRLTLLKQDHNHTQWCQQMDNQT